MIDIDTFLMRHPEFNKYKPAINVNTVKSVIASYHVFSSSKNVIHSLNELLEYALFLGVEQLDIQYYYCSYCGYMTNMEQHDHCGNCCIPYRRSGYGCNMCNSCCRESHFRCSCGSHSISYCRQCKLCDSCCKCERCLKCGTYPMTCLSCGRCKESYGNDGCCNCVPGFHKFYEADSISDRKYFNCKRKVGVEWEYNTTKIHAPIAEWAVKWRGRVHRDRSCGREAVSPPLAGDHIDCCLTELNNTLLKTNAVANVMCGIHVHVAANDLKWVDMLRLLKVYSIIEPILYIIGGQHRITNKYCMPCGSLYASCFDKQDIKGAILGAAFSKMNGREYMRTGPGRKDHGRYRGLNIIPWLTCRNRSDATVEFRMHRNSLDKDQVVNWAKLCAKIVDWCSFVSNNEINQLPKSGLQVLANVIAPELKPWIVQAIKKWRSNFSRENRLIRFQNMSYNNILG